MQNVSSDATREGAATRFSVVVPLEYHREKWRDCLRHWLAQTLPRQWFELIVVLPPDFPNEELALFPEGNLIVVPSKSGHDVTLAAIGAARARGEFIFFTEAHCWPESDVLEKCLEKFAAEPHLAGFSCRSMRITHNRLSEVEADMYDADIEYGMTTHPWLKILDQCFVTRRDAYEICGGLKPDLGHFAEWYLAASYYRHNLVIGYLPDARFHHFYIGELRDLEVFTRDFANGEMRFFCEYALARDDQLLAPPAEWWLRGNFDRDLVASLCLAARIGVRRWRLALCGIGALVRWTVPSLVGAKFTRFDASVRRRAAFVWLSLARALPNRAHLAKRFKSYIASLIHEARIDYLAGTQSGTSVEPTAASWNIFTGRAAGLHSRETYEAMPFRWSDTTAVLCSWMPAGSHVIRIECLPVRSLSNRCIAFFLDENEIPTEKISVVGNTIRITVDVPESGPVRLAWLCTRFLVLRDRRRLGLPIRRIECLQACASRASAVAESNEPVALIA